MVDLVLVVVMSLNGLFSKKLLKKHLFLLTAYKNNLFNENHLSMPMNHLR